MPSSECRYTNVVFIFTLNNKTYFVNRILFRLIWNYSQMMIPWSNVIFFSYMCVFSLCMFLICRSQTREILIQSQAKESLFWFPHVFLSKIKKKNKKSKIDWTKIGNYIRKILAKAQNFESIVLKNSSNHLKIIYLLWYVKMFLFSMTIYNQI